MAQDIDIQNLSPDAQLTGFSKTSFLKSFMLSAVFHVIFVGATSTMAVVALFMDEPEKEEVVADAETDDKASKDGEADPAKADGQSDTDGNTEADPAKADGEASTTDGDGSKDPTEDPRFQNEEYKKKMNETAPPPTEPELGIDLDKVGI